MFKLINESINETIANQIPIEYILSEYLSGAFDEPETKYPENNDVIENELDEDDEDLSDEEEFLPENKEIPIIPISNPVHSKVVEQLIRNNKEDRPEDTQGETEPHGDSIEDINELKSIEPGTDVTVNKQFDISDDDETDDESEDENEESQVKENTLF